MKNRLRTGLVATLLLARVVGAHEAAFKSPAGGMHFTQGQPVIVFADLFDSNNGHGIIACPGGQTVGNPPGGGQATCSGGGTPTGWPQMQVLVDGVVQTDSVTGQLTVPGTTVFNAQMNPDPIDFYRFSVTGIAPGVHQMRVRGHYAPPPDSDGSTLDSASITITVDPLPMPVTAPVTAPPDLGKGALAPASQVATCAISARIASFMPLAGQPSAILIPAMSLLFAGVTSQSVTADLAMLVPFDDGVQAPAVRMARVYAKKGD